MGFPNCIGAKVFWTQERVLAGLKSAADEIDGPLPCSDNAYYKIKSGRYDWPTCPRIYEYFGTMPRAWIAAGAAPERVTFKNQDWDDGDKLYILENAGLDTLSAIGKHIGRSYGSVRRRLYEMNITARGNQGWFSAAEVAKEYECSYHRVREMLAAGILKGEYDSVRNRWQVDVSKITPDVDALLRAPKKTHKTSPTDQGDYYQRYGIRRTMIDGKLVRVEGVN
jgi:hypothetical protein